MAVNKFRGDAVAVSKSENFTIGGTNTAANVVGVVCNGKTISFSTLGTETNAEIASALQLLLAASLIPEFTEVTWTVNSNVINGTDKVPGRDNSFSTSSSGTNTITKTTITAASGPKHWNVAANWSLGSIPTTPDDVVIDLETADIRYGLNQSSVSVNSFTHIAGKIGNNEWNGSYYEYRDKDIQIQTPNLIVGDIATNRGPSLLNINLGNGSIAGASLVKVYATGGQPSNGDQTVKIRGTHANNVVEVLSGSVGIATRPGETSTILTLLVGYISNVNSDVSLTCGSGCTIGTVRQRGGSISIKSSIATRYDGEDGEVSFIGDVINIPILNIQGGVVYYMGTGTIASITLGTSGGLDFSRDLRSRTITSMTVQAGTFYRDRMRTAVWTNPPRIECALNELVEFDIGSNFNIQWS